jgi:hypothetical protein
MGKTWKKGNLVEKRDPKLPWQMDGKTIQNKSLYSPLFPESSKRHQ